MANPKVLIGPGGLRGKPGPFRAILANAGFTLVEPEGGDVLPPHVVREAIADAEAFLVGGEALPPDLFDVAPRLRVVARVGVGYDQVDVPAATGRGVVVTITPGTNHGSVAEHVFALLLALTRDIPDHDRAIRQGIWRRALCRPLRGQTLGLVGFGRIGQAVAARAAVFEMRVIAHDPVLAPEGFGAVEPVGLFELLERSDFVSLHLPLSQATRQCVNREFLSRMKPGSLLINTARGGVVHEADLLDALNSGQLAGAGLDVLDREPPPDDHPFLQHPRIVMTPHVAGVDERSLADMTASAANSVAVLRQGGWPEECVVNRELRVGWTW